MDIMMELDAVEEAKVEYLQGGISMSDILRNPIYNGMTSFSKNHLLKWAREYEHVSDGDDGKCRKEKNNMKFKVGDKVVTMVEKDLGGFKRFPVGTVGTIQCIEDDLNTYLRIEVHNNKCDTYSSSYWYGEDELKLAEDEVKDEVKTYEQGLKDGEARTLEIINKLRSYDGNERVKIFNHSDAYHFGWVLDSFTVDEIGKKIEEYENANNFKVGDVVVTSGGNKAVITAISAIDRYYVLWEDGSAGVLPSSSNVKKTGRTIDISAVLNALNEKEGN